MTRQTRTELSPILFFGFVERRISVLNVGQTQLYFQSAVLSLDIFAFPSLSSIPPPPLLSIPPCLGVW